MKRIFTYLVFLLIFCNSAYSQKVGLVLSGGGAKGFAHIGVIRTLEENNIPIDYITGTSIGAIVGALYASGYSPDEMEALFRSKDFYFWSTGQIQEEYRYFFKKQEEDPSWLELKFKMKEEKLKILPPTNLIPQEQMDFAFMELMASTNAVCNNDFDKLMVPFRCIAADVYKNQPVVLKSGDLGEAVRASMTVPFYFKPISINGTLLFDGGIYNNFPSDVMKDVFKPDIIIGHQVADGNTKPEADDLMEQLMSLVMRPTNYNIAPEDGIFLQTKFTNVGLLDFKKLDFIEEEGRKTAMALIDSIKKRITRRIPISEVKLKRENFNKRKPKLLFHNIQVEGVSDPMQRKFIIQSIKHKENIFTLNTFRKEYFKLVADEQIKSMRPVAHFNSETGYFDLHIKVEPEKKFKVKFGGNVSTKPINQGFFNLEYRMFKDRSYTLSSNIYFGRFYSSFKFGGRIDFPSKLPFYLAGYTTLNRWDFFTSSGELFFEDVRPPFIIQDEYNIRFEAGIPLGVRSKLSGGIAYSNSRDEYYLTKIFKKEDEPDKTDFSAFVTNIGFESNSLNYRQYATEGKYQCLSYKFISGKETNFPGTTSASIFESKSSHKYYLVKGFHSKYYRMNKALTIGTHIEGVYSNKNSFINYTSSVLSAPGFYPTPHSKSMFIENFHANKYVAGGLKSIIHLNDQMHLRFEGYFFSPVHLLTKTESFKVRESTKIFETAFFQGMAALVYQTHMGPISFSANYYEKSSTNLFLSLNFGYILFNSRGL